MTKIIVRREVLHQLAQKAAGRVCEARPDSERQAGVLFASALALATAARGGKVEIEVVE